LSCPLPVVVAYINSGRRLYPQFHRCTHEPPPPLIHYLAIALCLTAAIVAAQIFQIAAPSRRPVAPHLLPCRRKLLQLIK
jgi:hypothetical protein